MLQLTDAQRLELLADYAAAGAAVDLFEVKLARMLKQANDTEGLEAIDLFGQPLGDAWTYLHHLVSDAQSFESEVRPQVRDALDAELALLCEPIDLS